MAGDVKEPIKPTPSTFACCASKPPASVVVCILCNALYHISCSERKNFVSLGGALGVCCMKRTSKSNLVDKDAKDVMIIQLKENLLKLQEDYINQLKLGDKSRKKMDSSASSEVIPEPYESIQRENELLNALVNEMKDKNTLLVEKNSNLSKQIEEYKTNSSPSYASVLSSNVPNKNTQSYTTSLPIIITSKNRSVNQNIRESFVNMTNHSEFDAKVISLKELNNGELRIQCHSNDDAAKVLEKVNTDMGEVFTASYEKLDLPKLKIVGIKRKYEPKELEKDLVSLNFNELKEKVCKVTYIQEISSINNNASPKERGRLHEDKIKYTAYLEVDPAIYNKVMRTGKIFVKYQRCNVYEELNLKRCFKCCGYGHNSKKCNNKIRCGYCGDEHETKSCDQKDRLKCVNCVESNEKYKTKRNWKHAALDSDKCDTFKSRRTFLKSKINYSISVNKCLQAATEKKT